MGRRKRRGKKKTRATTAPKCTYYIAPCRVHFEYRDIVMQGGHVVHHEQTSCYPRFAFALHWYYVPQEPTTPPRPVARSLGPYTYDAVSQHVLACSPLAAKGRCGRVPELHWAVLVLQRASLGKYFCTRECSSYWDSDVSQTSVWLHVILCNPTMQSD